MNSSASNILVFAILVVVMMNISIMYQQQIELEDQDAILDTVIENQRVQANQSEEQANQSEELDRLLQYNTEIAGAQRFNNKELRDNQVAMAFDLDRLAAALEIRLNNTGEGEREIQINSTR